MTITSVGYGATLLGQSVLNLNNQLSTLTAQLSSGKKATTYAGFGSGESFAVAARAQLSNIAAFGDTATNVNTTINVANTALQALTSIAGTVQSGAASTQQALNSSGQTVAQQTASSQLSSAVGILNTQAGDRYVFSGNAIGTPSVASADNILNGNGAQAGLKQVISEREQADLGTDGLGRLQITSPTPTSVSIGEDAAGSPFGLKLSAVTSSLTGATVSGPSGSPAAASIDLASNPNPGDQVTFTFNLPDGTTEAVQLTASNATPTPAGSFAIGATPAATAANLNAALTTSIGSLANTSLVAASAIAASNNFFDDPPQRVGTTPLGAATTLVNGTSANTVAWYTGDAGTGSARASATARVDQSITVQYGTRANEEGIRSQVQSIAVFAAFSTSTSDPNAAAQAAALSQRVTQNLTAQPGQQSIADIQTDLAAAQTTIKDATDRQTQTQSQLQNLVDETESISPDQVASQILALQTNLQASYQTTALLAQLSLTKFLPLA